MNVNKSTDHLYNVGGENDQTYHTMYRATYNNNLPNHNHNQQNKDKRPATVDRSAV